MEIGKGIVVKRTSGDLNLITKGDNGYLNMTDPYTDKHVGRIEPDMLDECIESGDLKFCWTVEAAEKW